MKALRKLLSSLGALILFRSFLSIIQQLGNEKIISQNWLHPIAGVEKMSAPLLETWLRAF